MGASDDRLKTNGIYSLFAQFQNKGAANQSFANLGIGACDKESSELIHGMSLGVLSAQ
jgi:hypothetical protein